MAAIAPDTTETAPPGWLASFVERWEPGPVSRSRTVSLQPAG